MADLGSSVDASMINSPPHIIAYFISFTAQWEVDRRGMFDYLVIAHNGKCADRLMSQAGVPQIHDLLRVRFTPALDVRNQTMQLCSLWVLMIKVKTKLGLPFEGLHVDKDREVRFTECYFGLIVELLFKEFVPQSIGIHFNSLPR